MKTGLQILMLALGYMTTVFIVFSYMPMAAFQVSGGSLPTLNSSFNSTGSYDDVANVGIFDLMEGMLSFGITGAAVPVWLSIVGAYIPLVMVLLGVYALIRGI